MTEHHGEQRRFPRLPAEHVVLVKKLGTGEAEEFVKTRTVGTGGCMFVSDGSLGLGTGVELLISVHGKVVQARGNVVWEQPMQGKDVQVGVEFMQMRPEDQRVLEQLFAERPEE